MAIFLPLNPNRRKRHLGDRGTRMSNPNIMTRDEKLSYQERLQLDGLCNRLASPGTRHRIPETCERVISIIKQKLSERHADGPAGFLKLFRDIDADHGGTIDREEMRTFLDYYHLGQNDSVFEEVFRRLDIDNSGDIDMNEFLEHLFDRSADGKPLIAEEGLLHSRQAGGSEEFQRPGPAPKDCQPITTMNAEQVIALVREKVENRTPLDGGRVKTSFQFFKRGANSITRKHFFEVLKQFNIVLASEKLADEVWSIFDEDGDGSLSFEEFIDHFIGH
jgi:Ca2+-binding EF-hand superfamily protein